ncbi:MAG: hypothetical protein HYR90_04505 [Candidatus Andersenbacteria bacterium]|nr:hypothetical protein [Candidatus Andersenbacteria bacterium]MBI3250466.1 hypothetical protein [Candidatus Andersenbacteria bacterium]
MARDQALPDAQEVLVTREGVAGETYLFEPGTGETRLGWLFAALQTRDREGIGSEILDTVATAIQREYYRDPRRSAASSFELALHQANLILHDMAEQGMRDWMVDFHASVVALAGNELHISVAGEGQVLLARKANLTNISVGLAHSPITDPLQTFSQVASGIAAPRDTLYVAGSPLSSIVAETELKRLALENSANIIASRLTQQTKDTSSTTSLAAVVVVFAPQYAAREKDTTMSAAPAGGRAVNRSYLTPRQPLIIHRGLPRQTLSLLGKGSKAAFNFTRERVWPHVKSGSRQGGRALLQVSKVTGSSLKNVATDRAGRVRFKLPNPTQMGKSAAVGTAQFTLGLRQRLTTLPKSSKLFGVISLILLVLLGGSLLLLQQKRASDAAIQQASETLQEARAKAEAAKTALIYDNRDQANGLLDEASTLTQQLQGKNIYIEESRQLLTEIEEQRDRLQRISRVDSAKVKTIGDFEANISKTPQRLFFVSDALYAYHPENNAIVRMALDGTSQVVQQTSQGIGFFTEGIVHTPDKTITLITDPAGAALFDTKDNSLSKQEISFASTKPVIADAAVFGNRLYVLDRSINNILSYNKTLRGYSAGTPWITDQNFPVRTIVNIAVDGNVYTLHEDGSIHSLFKGVAAEFNQEAVSPIIPATARIITTDEYQFIYVIDPANKRIVVYDKNGKLIRQHVVDVASEFSDATIYPDETKAYVLDGTRVLEISLTE